MCRRGSYAPFPPFYFLYHSFHICDFTDNFIIIFLICLFCFILWALQIKSASLKQLDLCISHVHFQKNIYFFPFFLPSFLRFFLSFLSCPCKQVYVQKIPPTLRCHEGFAIYCPWETLVKPQPTFFCFWSTKETVFKWFICCCWFCNCMAWFWCAWSTLP